MGKRSQVAARAARTTAGKAGDVANARCELALDGATREGQAAQIALRGKKGAFPQSWAVPVGKAYPDVVEPVSLKLEGEKLAGNIKCLLGSAPYEYSINATMKALAGKNATIGLSWPRLWINGHNKAHEHGMDVTVSNGAVTAVVFKPLFQNSKAFVGVTESFAMQFDGQKLTGKVVVKSRLTMWPGRVATRWCSTLPWQTTTCRHRDLHDGWAGLDGASDVWLGHRS